MNNIFDVKSFFSGIIANICTAVVFLILGVTFFDDRRKLRPWIFSLFGEKFTRYLYKFINFLVNPWLRVVVILFLLFEINYRKGDVILSGISFLIILSFVLKSKFKYEFSPASEISDGFKNLDNWVINNGTPVIENNFGKPAPDLGLKSVTGDRMNSFVVLKNIECERGIVEFDFYLEENSLLDVVIFADIENDKWHMARYDSRKEYSDGFIIKDSGPGINWKNNILAGTQTTIKEWHRARVEFDFQKILMYRDGTLLLELPNPTIFGNKLGMFNELNDVHIDNFSFIKK